MLPTEPIIFLFDRFEHEWGRVHGLLNGGELAVLLEVDAAVCAEQDVLPAPVVPVFGGCVREEECGWGALPWAPTDAHHSLCCCLLSPRVGWERISGTPTPSPVSWCPEELATGFPETQVPPP